MMSVRRSLGHWLGEGLSLWFNVWPSRLCPVIYATPYGLVFVAFGLAVTLLVIKYPMLTVSLVVRHL